MSDYNTRFAMEPVRVLAFGDIGAVYASIGTSLESPAIQIVLQNLTDVQLMFSMNGIDDNLPLPASGFYLSDITSNQQVNRGLRIAAGTTFYVKRIGVPTSGAVYLTVCYAN